MTDTPDSTDTDRLAEAPNPHIFRLWEDLGTGLMEVECEAPECGWKATFNPPISADMKSQAIRFQSDHRQASALLSLVEQLQTERDDARAALERRLLQIKSFRRDGHKKINPMLCTTPVTTVDEEIEDARLWWKAVGNRNGALGLDGGGSDAE